MLTPEQRIERAIGAVRAELLRAVTIHPKPFNSAHEGYAVLKEEVDELWDDIKANDKTHAMEEATQVAAMATRFLVDLSEHH